MATMEANKELEEDLLDYEEDEEPTGDKAAAADGEVSRASIPSIHPPYRPRWWSVPAAGGVRPLGDLRSRAAPTRSN
jgi:hypothetical protein